ncbi:glycosyl hydrolase family 95 catalytic domain-containing protein [Sphingomonas sp. FW199]|uniref:glycosyl hydrolase family 95 catalytic domain-containing protein n=1 Tax=Sphingomonas sp. FW199 TaxID=3400217 RepID=UPI003CF8B069
MADEAHHLLLGRSAAQWLDAPSRSMQGLYRGRCKPLGDLILDPVHPGDNSIYRPAPYCMTPDPALSAQSFNFGRYLLIASSRPGTQPAILHGIGNDKARPPWSRNHTKNIKMVMNHWPAECCNLAKTVMRWVTPLPCHRFAVAHTGVNQVIGHNLRAGRVTRIITKRGVA